MLEVKHESSQILAWRTRGQVSLDIATCKKPILAKAGIKPPSTEVREQGREIIDLFKSRSFDTKLPFSRLSSVPEVFHHDADLVGMETEKRVLMDWDWKREPRPDYEDRILEGVPLLFFETKPWKNMKQFCDRRENWTKWSHGRGRVLKNSRDYEDFSNTKSFNHNCLLSFGEDR